MTSAYSGLTKTKYYLLSLNDVKSQVASEVRAASSKYRLNKILPAELFASITYIVSHFISGLCEQRNLSVQGRERQAFYAVNLASDVEQCSAICGIPGAQNLNRFFKLECT